VHSQCIGSCTLLPMARCGTAEPGPILTPSDKASDADDGYLTASEIALNLDAV